MDFLTSTLDYDWLYLEFAAELFLDEDFSRAFLKLLALLSSLLKLFTLLRLGLARRGLSRGELGGMGDLIVRGDGDLEGLKQVDISQSLIIDDIDYSNITWSPGNQKDSGTWRPLEWRGERVHWYPSTPVWCLNNNSFISQYQRLLSRTWSWLFAVRARVLIIVLHSVQSFSKYWDDSELLLSAQQTPLSAEPVVFLVLDWPGWGESGSRRSEKISPRWGETLPSLETSQHWLVHTWVGLSSEDDNTVSHSPGPNSVLTGFFSVADSLLFWFLRAVLKLSSLAMSVLMSARSARYWALPARRPELTLQRPVIFTRSGRRQLRGNK